MMADFRDLTRKHHGVGEAVVVAHREFTVYRDFVAGTVVVACDLTIFNV